MSVLPPMAAVFDQVAQAYETVGPPFFDRFGALLVEAAGVRPGDRVLDLAAGSGSVSLPALDAAGDAGSLLAVDLAPGMVARLSGRLTGRPAEVVAGGVADTTGLAAPASVDVALCGFGLFFLADPVAALRSWSRLLRTGGTLGVSTWGREDEVFGALRDAFLDLGVQSRPPGQAFDDADVLAATLRGAGLAQVQVTTVSVGVTLADVDELLRWAATHGARVWLDQLDRAGGARLRDRLVERWPGSVRMSWQAHLAVGRQARVPHLACRHAHV